MYYEPMRMKRWLSIHSIIPKKFRDLDERFILQKYPILKFKISGDTIDANFKEFKEQQHQLAIQYQLEEVQRDNQAGDNKHQFGILSTETDNPYDNSSSDDDFQYSPRNSKLLSSARRRGTMQQAQQQQKQNESNPTLQRQRKESIVTQSAQATIIHPQPDNSKYRSEVNQAKSHTQQKQIYYNLKKNNFQSIDVSNVDQSRLRQNNSQNKLLSKFADQKLSQNNSKHTLFSHRGQQKSSHQEYSTHKQQSKERSKQPSQSTYNSQQYNNQNFTELSKQQSIRQIQSLKTMVSENRRSKRELQLQQQQLQNAKKKNKIILHKHTIKVLSFELMKQMAFIRPASSHVSLTINNQNNGITNSVQDNLSRKSSNNNNNNNNVQQFIQSTQQQQDSHRPQSSYLDKVQSKSRISHYDLLTKFNDFHLDYVPKQVYFKYVAKPKYKPSEPIPALYDRGCLTCGQKNVEVTYHGERHVCFKCKKYLQTPDGKPVMLISTPDHRILAFFKKLRPAKTQDKEGTVATEDDNRKYSYVEVDPNDLRIFDKHCYATYGEPGELIVLLKDENKDSKQQ